MPLRKREEGYPELWPGDTCEASAAAEAACEEFCVRSGGETSPVASTLFGRNSNLDDGVVCSLEDGGLLGMMGMKGTRRMWKRIFQKDTPRYMTPHPTQSRKC